MIYTGRTTLTGGGNITLQGGSYDGSYELPEETTATIAATVRWQFETISNSIHLKDGTKIIFTGIGKRDVTLIGRRNMSLPGGESATLYGGGNVSLQGGGFIPQSSSAASSQKDSAIVKDQSDAWKDTIFAHLRGFRANSYNPKGYAAAVKTNVVMTDAGVPAADQVAKPAVPTELKTLPTNIEAKQPAKTGAFGISQQVLDAAKAKFEAASKVKAERAAFLANIPEDIKLAAARHTTKAPVAAEQKTEQKTKPVAENILRASLALQTQIKASHLTEPVKPLFQPITPHYELFR